jgi:ketosteroid isomerase-like protein
MSPNEQLIRDLYVAVERDEMADDPMSYWHADAEQVEYPSLLRPGGHTRDLAGIVAGAQAGRALIREQHYDIHTVIEQDDRLAVQFTWRGTLAIDAAGMIAGSELVAHIAAFYEMRDGRILRQSSYDCYEPLPVPAS